MTVAPGIEIPKKDINRIVEAIARYFQVTTDDVVLSMYVDVEPKHSKLKWHQLKDVTVTALVKKGKQYKRYEVKMNLPIMSILESEEKPLTVTTPLPEPPLMEGPSGG